MKNIVQCPTCHGDGTINEHVGRPKVCTTCGGKGRVVITEDDRGTRQTKVLQEG